MKLVAWTCGNCKVVTFTESEYLEYCSHCGRDNTQTDLSRKLGYVELTFVPIEEEASAD